MSANDALSLWSQWVHLCVKRVRTLLLREGRSLQCRIGKEIRKEAALARNPRRTASTNGVETVERLSREEGKQLVDRQARKYLKMSGEDFVRQYREGRIKDPDRLAVSRVAILLPLVES